MNALPQTCSLRFLYLDSDGDAHCVADCGPCYTVKWSPNPDGPWYFDRDGTAGQDIPIEPGTERRYYKVFPRECEPDEETPTPVPVPTGDQIE